MKTKYPKQLQYLPKMDSSFLLVFQSKGLTFGLAIRKNACSSVPIYSCFGTSVNNNLTGLRSLAGPVNIKRPGKFCSFQAWRTTATISAVFGSNFSSSLVYSLFQCLSFHDNEQVAEQTFCILKCWLT